MDVPRVQVRGPGGTREIPLESPRLTVGRAPSCDLVLDERIRISREHCEFVRENGRIWLRDLGSEFGTFVNRERIQARPLEHGDRIHLAEFELPEIVYLLDREEALEIPSPPREPSPTETTSVELQAVAGIVEALRLLGSAGVLSQVLRKIVDGAIELAGADRGFLLLPDAQGRLAVQTARGRGGVSLAPEELETSRRLPLQVFETGRARLIDLRDPSQAREHSQTFSLGIHAAACIPLDTIRHAELDDRVPAGARRIGVLYLDSRSHLHLCSPLALPLLEGLAQKAAMSIWNVQLLQDAEALAHERRTLEIAAEIQFALQPPECLQGSFFEVAGCSIPCQGVGGDFFDYFVSPADPRLSLVLADVAGKGLPASLLASLVQGGFSALTRRTSGPVEVVNSLNDLLHARGNPSRFVTLFHGELAPDGRLRSCNAGHNPPMIARADGSLTLLESGGFPLGIFADQSYPEHTARMEPEDLLVVFSDGVTEALNAQEEIFGEDRLNDCLFQLRGRPATEVLHSIHEAVKDFVDEGPFQDDLTILVVRYLGPGGDPEAWHSDGAVP